MLVKIYRKVVFIHDNYIYASHLFGSTYRELPNYILPLIRKDKKKEPVHIVFLARLSGKNPPRPGDFYEQLEKVSEDEVTQVNERVREIRPHSVYEYSLRGLPRKLFDYLVRMGYVWVIPYNTIRSIRRVTREGGDVIEISYDCPFTNKLRIFRTVYDAEVYDLIKQLCKNSGNTGC